MVARRCYLALFGRRRHQYLVGDMVFPRVIPSAFDLDGYYGVLVTIASPVSRRSAGA
jgi:hypothetical protein